jgi:hypothetical protein
MSTNIFLFNCHVITYISHDDMANLLPWMTLLELTRLAFSVGEDKGWKQRKQKINKISSMKPL